MLKRESDGWHWPMMLYQSNCRMPLESSAEKITAVCPKLASDTITTCLRKWEFPISEKWPFQLTSFLTSVVAFFEFISSATDFIDATVSVT